MSEIVTYDSEEEAMKWRPRRQGFEYVLYYNPVTGLFQWINDERYAELFDLLRTFPYPFWGGFGISPFGIAPFGS